MTRALVNFVSKRYLLHMRKSKLSMTRSVAFSISSKTWAVHISRTKLKFCDFIRITHQTYFWYTPIVIAFRVFADIVLLPPDDRLYSVPTLIFHHWSMISPSFPSSTHRWAAAVRRIWRYSLFFSIRIAGSKNLNNKNFVIIRPTHMNLLNRPDYGLIHKLPNRLS